MSPFSSRPLFFSPPKVIRSSNNHPLLVTRCLRHAATSHPSTSLTTCQRPRRSFTSTPRRPFAIKTVEAARSRNRSGPFTFGAALLFLAVGAGGYLYFQYEKARLERQRIADAAKGVGRPKVGGAFKLVDHGGKPFSDGDMKGGFSLVYFGFTHCPDICPEELDKMSRMIDLVSPSAEPASSSPSSPSSTSARPGLLPLFITCDPARDTPSVLKSYLSEFHPSILGLTGTWEQIRQVCKAYRVYFSTPEGVKPGMDYLVDHSIYFYLMDPEGDFIEAIGRQHSAEKASRIIKEHMSDWKDGKKLS